MNNPILTLASLFLNAASILTSPDSSTAGSDSPRGGPPRAAPVDDGNEPPINPFLAESPWPMIHRNPYAQASSPFPGPTASDELTVDLVVTATGTSTLVYSNPASNGKRVIWTNNPFHTGKIDPTGNSLVRIDEFSDGLTLDALSGAYYFLDKDGVLFAPRASTLRSFTDAVPGDPFSGVKPLNEFELPLSVLASAEDSLLSQNLLYDGHVVFCTAQGMVGVIQRDLSTDLHVIQLGAGDEEVSNGMAVDENGGIYVVTSKHLYRVNWDGANLSIAWTADYEVGPDQPVGGRLGIGSGSTPTLMGTGDQDKFVVITDGSPLMNIVLFWRDEIPGDWVGIQGKDRRIAAEVPVTFGHPNAQTSVSEQSVLVRGYGAVVVNNDYNFNIPEAIPDVENQLLVLFTNLPEYAPFGVEKFEWNNATRTLDVAWANPDISCPNGIPTMSTATNLVYCIGQRNSEWNLEALDWDTGESVFHKPAGLELRFNSGYAAAEIGVDGEIVSGTARGAMRVRRAQPGDSSGESPGER